MRLIFFASAQPSMYPPAPGPATPPARRDRLVMQDTPRAAGETGGNAQQPLARDPVPHTHVHALVRRTLENAQDVVATFLMVILLLLSVHTLVRIARMAIAGAGTSPILSEILFVLILMEVYRLLIFYLREHRISVTLAVEVALVSTLRELIFMGAHEFESMRLFALSVLLVVLGALLAAERWAGFVRNNVSETSVR
jgi:uncharacterized membrane protein (DUF373 family)